MIKSRKNKLEREQKAIIKYIFKGLSNEQIASKLHYSRSTISYRINMLFEKYCVNSRQELILAILAQLVASKKDLIKKQIKRSDLLEQKLNTCFLILKNIIFDFENGVLLNHRIEEAKLFLKNT